MPYDSTEAKEAFDSEQQYWPTLDGKELACAAMRRFEEHISILKRSGRHQRMLRSWRLYYARGEQGGWEGGTEDTTQIQSAGVQGELTTISPNRYRARIQRVLNMAVGEKPSYEAQAVNTDADAIRECELADGLLGYYLHHHKLQIKRRERAETALVLSESWIAAPWDPNRGKPYTMQTQEVLDEKGEPVLDDDGNPKTEEKPVFDGEFRFIVMTPYDTAICPFAEDPDDPPWAVFRYPVNKWDQAVKYPAQREKILSLQAHSSDRKEMSFLPTDVMSDDAVWEYCVVHAKTPACPDGLIAFFADSDTLLGAKSGFPYMNIGGLLSRCTPSNVILQDGGYTPGFDLLSVVQARAATMSAVLSNQTAAGVQMFVMDKNADVTVDDIGPLKFVKVNPGARFDAVNLSRTAPETFTFLEVLEAEEDFVSAVNAAARGDVQASKGDSGKKSALMFAAAQQQQSGIAEAIQFSDEALLTHVIHTLQTHASTERVATIAGKYNTYASRKWKSKDIEHVLSVLVHKANPMRDTSEGRMQILQIFMEMGRIETPEQVWTVLTTGRLDPLYEGELADVILARKENEVLREGGDEQGQFPIMALPYDAHALHIREHKSLLADPRVRLDPALVARVRQHVEEHVYALRGGVDPAILAVIGEKPLPPPGMGPGGPPGKGPPGKPPMGPPAEPGAGLPTVPKPSENPTTGEPVTNAAPPEMAPMGA